MVSIENEKMKKCCVCGETRTPIKIEIEPDSAITEFTDGVCVECFLHKKRIDATVNTKYVNVQKIGVNENE